MLVNETVSKLTEMHLSVMARSFENQLNDSKMNELSFEDRFSMIVDREWTTRKNNKLRNLMKKAEYSIPSASIEDIIYNKERNLDKAQIQRLATCSYIAENHNVIIMGATGTGKTYLGCALGVAANREFYSTKYIRLPDLLAEIQIARGDGSYFTAMNRYKKVNLLIIDEWLLYPLKEEEARILLEIVEARNKVASTIFCSQVDTLGWHDYLYEPTMADAICDRIVNNSHIITIMGDSIRKLNAVKD